MSEKTHLPFNPDNDDEVADWFDKHSTTNLPGEPVNWTVEIPATIRHQRARVGGAGDCKTRWGKDSPGKRSKTNQGLVGCQANVQRDRVSKNGLEYLASSKETD